MRDSYHLFLVLSLPVWPDRYCAHERTYRGDSFGQCVDRNMRASHRYIKSALTGEINAYAIAVETSTLIATVQYE